jgi:hypothetical protein
MTYMEAQASSKIERNSNLKTKLICQVTCEAVLGDSLLIRGAVNWTCSKLVGLK